MDDSFAVTLANLPEYGLRTRSRTASAIHRFAEDRPIPACATEVNGGAMATNPGDYTRIRLGVAAESRRFSLCSHGHCFGRLRLTNSLENPLPEQPTDALDTEVV